MANIRGRKTRRGRSAKALRTELERHIEAGRCAYCRAPARPGDRLTREHIIPRARGGRRKDVRIIVPACATCNHERGCRDLIPFLLMRPMRITALLEYLRALSEESIREVDLRIFAELYAAISILRESGSVRGGSPPEAWRSSSGRSLHRRRYAARRTLAALESRFDGTLGRNRGSDDHRPADRTATPSTAAGTIGDGSAEPMAEQLLAILALMWGVTADMVEREIRRLLDGEAAGEPEDPRMVRGGTVLEAVPPRRSPRSGRVRVDQRRGRGVQRRAVAGRRAG